MFVGTHNAQYAMDAFDFIHTSSHTHTRRRTLGKRQATQNVNAVYLTQRWSMICQDFVQFFLGSQPTVVVSEFSTGRRGPTVGLDVALSSHAYTMYGGARSRLADLGCSVDYAPQRQAGPRPASMQPRRHQPRRPDVLHVR